MNIQVKDIFWLKGSGKRGSHIGNMLAPGSQDRNGYYEEGQNIQGSRRP